MIVYLTVMRIPLFDLVNDKKAQSGNLMHVFSLALSLFR